MLWIRLEEDVCLSFGRFKRGKLISLHPGAYIYVGSALSKKGATSLARRLSRHATRSGAKPPHRIRDIMINQFAERGLGNGNLLPKRGKTLYWNIDFLLDLQSAEIERLIAIRSPERLEQKLAKWLEEERQTQVIERGIGANDTPGNTHLLHVCADNVWWESLVKNVDRIVNGNP